MGFGYLMYPHSLVPVIDPWGSGRDTNKDHIEELKAQLARKFKMKDLELANKILAMQIHQDENNRKIWLL